MTFELSTVIKTWCSSGVWRSRVVISERAYQTEGDTPKDAFDALVAMLSKIQLGFCSN